MSSRAATSLRARQPCTCFSMHVNVQEIKAKLEWDVLGAIPEMLQTAYGSLFRALHLKSSDRLLIRGATTSVGLAALAIAKNHGSFVAATTRNSAREGLLKQAGADQVLVDTGSVASQAQVETGIPRQICMLLLAANMPESIAAAHLSDAVCREDVHVLAGCPCANDPRRLLVRIFQLVQRKC